VLATRRGTSPGSAASACFYLLRLAGAPVHGAAGAAAVAIFVPCNKVYSPTYDVWLAVCFVLLPLSRRLWVTFCVVDLAVFVTV
jgi:hypothetical protein